MAVRLLRRLVLESAATVADGSGGFAVTWVPEGTLWADVTARSGREDFVGGAGRSRSRYRIVVRGAPVGAPSRPRTDQRLREGGRVFDILTVTEQDAGGRYLEILAEEGVLP
jgi:SPP1 family predicted phage head-tail adaptor